LSDGEVDSSDTEGASFKRGDSEVKYGGGLRGEEGAKGVIHERSIGLCIAFCVSEP